MYHNSNFSPTFSFFGIISLDFHFAYSVDYIPLLDPDRRNGYGVLVFSQHFSFFETHKESNVWI